MKINYNKKLIGLIVLIIAVFIILSSINYTKIKEIMLFAKDHDKIKTDPRPTPEDAVDRFKLTGEVEVSNYMGQRLTPIEEQRKGNKTLYVDKDEYLLEIYGLVDRPINLTYEDIKQDMPRISKLADMYFIDGDFYTAKWTGVLFWDLLGKAKAYDTDARYATFYSVDGTTTQLTLNYLIGEEIVLAYKVNEISITPEQGFPLILAAEEKYDYKWAKWITKIEITDKEHLGTMERKGYDNWGGVVN